MTSFSTHSLARIRTVFSNRSDPEYARDFAELYWRTLTLVACVIIIGAALYGASLFFSTLSELNAIAPSPASASPVSSKLNQAKLEATLSGFAARQADFQALQSSALPAIADPSQ